MGMIFDSCIWMGLATGQIATSAVIDAAGELPVYTSALSIGELSFGVHACTDATERAMRAAYLRQVESRPVLNLETAVGWACQCRDRRARQDATTQRTPVRKAE